MASVFLCRTSTDMLPCARYVRFIVLSPTLVRLPAKSPHLN
jgi:hypothetical protein